MAKYKVKEKSFIDGRLVEAGEIVEYEGDAGSNLEPIKSKRSGAAEDTQADGTEQSV